MECPRCKKHTLVGGWSEDRPPVAVWTCTACTRMFMRQDCQLVPYKPALLSQIEKELDVAEQGVAPKSRCELNDAQQEKVFELLVSGTRSKVVAREVPCGVEQVYRYARKFRNVIDDERKRRGVCYLGPGPRKGSLLPEHYQTVVELLAAGEKTRAIANQYGYSVKTIQNFKTYHDAEIWREQQRRAEAAAERRELVMVG